MDIEFDLLQQRLGYTFGDLSLLIQALTHRSYIHEHAGDQQMHNERLEYLGDAVVSLCVGALLMELLPDAREGELTKLRAVVVRERGLARAARELDLGRHLRLGRGEDQHGGRRKDSLLSDAFEAVVGAVFLDAGFVRTDCVVRRLLRGAVEEAATRPGDRDYKGRLQELAQGALQVTPHYELLETRGPDHDKVFVAAAMLDSRELARAEGRSKKTAEQKAARLALKQLRDELA